MKLMRCMSTDLLMSRENQQNPEVQDQANTPDEPIPNEDIEPASA